MTSMEALWHAYTAQTLAWKLGADADIPPAPASAEAVSTACARLARMHRASGRSHCILLGVGDGQMVRALRAALPPEHSLLVLEGDMAAARAVYPALPDGVSLLADTSPMALLLLTSGVRTAEAATVAWTLPAQERATAPGTPVLDKWRHLFTGVRHEALPAPTTARLGVGCILHPDEPHLEGFFAHIPAWVQSVSIVWDGRAPAHTPACAAPVRSVTRPLDGDFATQRNAMRDLCRHDADWCLYLDADERLSPASWATLPRLMACAGAGGVCFPRVTFEGDTDHARMGYGLWPDAQLRLFALTADGGPHFEGRVHESLHGLHGDTLIAPGLPIEHYSHVHKNRAALRARLAVFDAAAGTPTHRLSEAYPCLPVDTLCRAQASFGAERVLRLPRT